MPEKVTPSEDWETFRSLRKYFNRITHSNYRKYIRETCAESSKKFWAFIKSLKADTFGISAFRDRGILITENAKKADSLNNQFKSVFTQEDITDMQTLGEGFPSCLILLSPLMVLRNS